MSQGPDEAPDAVSFSRASTWVVLCLTVGFLVLGVLFALAPGWGAALFGIPAPQGVGQAYVRAIGFRDAALALYIIALALFSTRRALCIVLGVTVLIPVCDVVLVAAVMGSSSPGHLALHAASALCFAALALWLARAEP